jgi:hypothetical protein
MENKICPSGLVLIELSSVRRSSRQNVCPWPLGRWTCNETIAQEGGCMVGPRESQGQPAGSLQFNQPRENPGAWPDVMRPQSAVSSLARPAGVSRVIRMEREFYSAAGQAPGVARPNAQSENRSGKNFPAPCLKIRRGRTAVRNPVPCDFPDQDPRESAMPRRPLICTSSISVSISISHLHAAAGGQASHLPVECSTSGLNPESRARGEKAKA